MNKIRIPAEQGDVTIIESMVDATILQGAKKRKPKNGRSILALGEATGHHHSLDSRVSTVYEVTPELRAAFNAEMRFPHNANVLDSVLLVGEPDVVTHQEHGPINIAPGIYWVEIEQEYSPAAIHRVID